MGSTAAGTPEVCPCSVREPAVLAVKSAARRMRTDTPRLTPAAGDCSRAAAKPLPDGPRQDAIGHGLPKGLRAAGEELQSAHVLRQALEHVATLE